MADIKQAAKWMQEGRVVARKGGSQEPIKWGPMTSRRAPGLELHENGLIKSASTDGLFLPFTFFHVDALLADDWELVDAD